MFYGSNVWDPGLIVAQIVSVQCLFYLALGLLQAALLGPILGHITVSYIFDWSTLTSASKLGALNCAAHLLNAAAGAAALAWVVERAKKCLDFGATCYTLHLLATAWYSGWPKSWAWWCVNGVGMLAMVLLGEWLCVRRELQDIPLSLPARLSGVGLLSRRKDSGAVGGGAGGVAMMPLPTDDPDLPPRPRLRTGLAAASTTTQRAAAAAAGASTSFNSSSGTAAAAAAAAAVGASPVQHMPSPGGPRHPGMAVQLAPLRADGGGGGAAAGSLATPPRPEGGALTSAAVGSGGGGVRAPAEGGLVAVSSSSSSSSRKKLLLARPASFTAAAGSSSKQQRAPGAGELELA